MLSGPAQVAGQLREQAASCAEMGSPLYAALLERAAKDAAGGGPVWQVLEAHLAPGRGDAVALRLMAALHRLVLTGEAPALARHYPSVGGDGDLTAAWDSFRAVVIEKPEAVRAFVALPCQTNEVGRAAALVVGFLELAAATRLPLRLLEVGASAGLNLRWDHFRYAGGGASWGDPASPVDLAGHWSDAPRHAGVQVTVSERRGCDRRPQDPTAPETRLALRASVWADQVARFARLEGALTLAGRVPASLDSASAAAWTSEQLREPRPGVATVVYHSVVEEYLPEEERGRFRGALAEAGARATHEAPLAWLRVEPISSLRRHGVTLTTWPGGEERLLATSGAHGSDVRIAR